MLETLEKWDRALFLLLNSWHNEFMDQMMFLISGKLEWIPLYVLLLVLLIRKYKKHVWLPLLAVGVVIVLADQSSVQLFKEIFERYRPCHNLEIKDMVHLVNNKCGGKFGFVSSHAANTFALATLVGLFLNRKTFYLLLVWAILVSYSRIYLGVHYPSDVFFGGLLGIILALIVYRISHSILIHRVK